MFYSTKVCEFVLVVKYFSFSFTGVSFIMLAYLSVAIECGEDSCSETWPRIVLAVTTVRSLRKVWYVLSV